MLPATVLLLTLLSDAIHLQVREGRPIIDGVYVNGHGPFRFLLDTGAERNELDVRLAQDLQLQATFPADIFTAAGAVRGSGARGLTLKLGPVEAGAQEVLFAGLETLHQWSPDVQGILGQGFLSRFDYLLDLRHHSIEFGAQQRDGLRVPFEILAGIPSVPTSLGMLSLDSGADRLIVFEKQPAGVRPTHTIQTEAGIVSAVLDVERPLVLGGRTIRHSGVLVVLQPRGVSPEGILPASLFQTVYVCNSEGYLVLTQ